MPTLKPENLTAIVDSREQQPYCLDPMASERGTLDTGDYSVKGLEHVIAIERKSLPDLLGCIGRDRSRFTRELSRLRGFPVSAVLVEASWQELERGEWRSKLKPNAVMGTVTSWVSRGHNVILAGNREMAQRICRSVLFHFAKYRHRESEEFMKLVNGGTK